MIIDIEMNNKFIRSFDTRTITKADQILITNINNNIKDFGEGSPNTSFIQNDVKQTFYTNKNGKLLGQAVNNLSDIFENESKINERSFVLIIDNTNLYSFN